MKYCVNCGKELNDEAVTCIHCGSAVSEGQTNNLNEAPKIGFAILGFFFPIIGLILYIVYCDSSPLKAKSAGKGALIGFVTSVVIGILLFVVGGFLIGDLITYFYNEC